MEREKKLTREKRNGRGEARISVAEERNLR